MNLYRRIKPKDSKSSEPRGYALPQSLRDRYNKLGKDKSDKHRYRKNAEFSTNGFDTLNDYEANDDGVELVFTATSMAADGNAPGIS